MHTLAYFLATYPPAAAAGAFLSRCAGSDALPPLALVATERPLTHTRHVCAREGVRNGKFGFIARQSCLILSKRWEGRGQDCFDETNQSRACVTFTLFAILSCSTMAWTKVQNLNFPLKWISLLTIIASFNIHVYTSEVTLWMDRLFDDFPCIYR